MEFMYGYIKNICIFMLVITLILNIFPEKSYIKYIKLFAGILLLLIVFNPILKIKNSNLDIGKIIEKYYEVNVDFNMDLENDVEEIQTKMFERIGEKYEEQSKESNGN